MSKLGVQSQHDGALDYIIAGKFPLWKIIVTNPTQFKRADVQRYKDATGGLVVARPFTNDYANHQGASPLGDGRNYAHWADDLLSPLRGVVDYVEILNEPEPTLSQNLVWLDQFTTQAALALRSYGWKSIGLNFSVGQPDYGRWPALLGAVKACDVVGVHGYGRKDAEDYEDTLLRYRKVHAILEGLGVHNKPIFLGECGVDGGLTGDGGKGYRTLLGPSNYRTFLESLAYAIAQDAYLMGAAMFGCGMFHDWSDFDIFPETTFYSLSSLPGKAGVPMPDVVLSIPINSPLSPNYEPGPRKVTRGLFIHDTTGPVGQQQDFDITQRYFDTPGTPASSQLLIGPSSTDRLVHDDDISWHARENNYTHLGLELADDDNHVVPYNDYQYKVASEYAVKAAAAYKFPLVRVFSQFEPGIIGHQDSEQGKRDGKTDPGPEFDWGMFLALCQGKSGVTPTHPHPAFPFDIGEGFSRLLTEHPEYGLPRQNVWYDSWGDGFVWTTGTPKYPKGSLLVWRKYLNSTQVVTW